MGRKAALARFWARVYFGKGCWEWKGRRDARLGYGFFCLKGRSLPAYQAAWVLTHGPIPVGMRLERNCTSASCVRPEHLSLVAET